MWRRRSLDKPLEETPDREIEWSSVERPRRVWLEEGGGDHVARLEFMAEQGLRLLMADVGPGQEGVLHFYNPRDRETLHLRAGDAGSLLEASREYFPEARRWWELLRGSGRPPGEARPGSALIGRDNLLLEAAGGKVVRVHEAARECPQAAIYGQRASQGGFALEGGGGIEGAARILSYLQALEEARGVRIPDAAICLRAVILECSRIRGHVRWLQACSMNLRRRGRAERCGAFLEGLDDAMRGWLGDPLGRGWCIPGGVREEMAACDPEPMAVALASLAGDWAETAPALRSLTVPRWAERRLGWSLEEAREGGWSGPLARCVGLERDVREEEAGVYAQAGWTGAVKPEARGTLKRMVETRVLEASSSIDVARRLLENLPPGNLAVKRGRGGRGEGFGRCEGPEGEVCCHLTLERGRVSAIAMSLPLELNRSSSRVLEGAWLDEADILSLLWEGPCLHSSVSRQGVR